MNTKREYFESIWSKYVQALGADQSGCDLDLLSDFLKEFAKEQLVVFDKNQKGGRFLEARVSIGGDEWGQAVEFVGQAIMNSIRVYDIQFITTDIKLKVVDDHLEMSMMAVFGEESKI